MASLIATLLAAVVFAIYFWAALRQRHRNRGWKTWRILVFLLGSILLILALSPDVMGWAHHDIRGHMVQHLLIGMLAPLAWVWAAPVTLLLKTLPPSGARGITHVLHRSPLRFITHPIVAATLNVGGMYALYLTPLYAATLHDAVLHHWLHVHFLVAGYLFCWSTMAGPDRSPHANSLLLRLGVLLVSLAAHSILAKLMYGYLWPRNTFHSAAEIQAAAQWMYYGGAIAEVLLVISVFALWYRDVGVRRAQSRRFTVPGYGLFRS